MTQQKTRAEYEDQHELDMWTIKTLRDHNLELMRTCKNWEIVVDRLMDRLAKSEG